MKTLMRGILAIMALLAMLATPAAMAHHSFAMFDMDREIKLEGLVKSVEWTNPHIWINLTRKLPGGETEEWGIEAGATNTMIRQGWKRDSLKPGDHVSVTARPMRNGSKACSLITMTLPDGRVLSLGVQGAKTPY